jgi:hypothetical protein
MKRTLQELLARRFRVHANPLSYNTDVGLPLAILGCELDRHRPLALAAELAQAVYSAYAVPHPVDVMVLELGVRQPGDMRAHLDIVQPDIVIVTPLASSYRDDHEALEILRSALRATAPPHRRANRSCSAATIPRSPFSPRRRPVRRTSAPTRSSSATAAPSCASTASRCPSAATPSAPAAAAPSPSPCASAACSA